jgi:hypothetical protein
VAGKIDRHRERPHVDKLGTPTQKAGLVPLIVYSAIPRGFAGHVARPTRSIRISNFYFVIST